MKKHKIEVNRFLINMYDEQIIKMGLLLQLCKYPDRFKYKKIIVPSTRVGQYVFKLNELKKELKQL